jgi:septum formation protein
VSLLVLASASPRRRELLARAGIAFDVDPADVDETMGAGEAPIAYAARVAADKAAVVRARRPADWVLAADTIVTLGADVLGKPEDARDAERMLRRLAGRAHVVTTAVRLAGPGADEAFATSTEVVLRAVTDGEIAGYVASGEWRGKAGGYAAQGIAAAFITELRGSYTSVVGLPLAETIQLLARTGAAAADLARGTPE